MPREILQPTLTVAELERLLPSPAAMFPPRARWREPMLVSSRVGHPDAGVDAVLAEFEPAARVPAMDLPEAA